MRLVLIAALLASAAYGPVFADARQLLSSGFDKQWTKLDCQHYVKLLVPDEARVFGAFLWDISSKWYHFADDAGERTLISYSRDVTRALLCLAAADSRLRVTQDRYLTLSEW